MTGSEDTTRTSGSDGTRTGFTVLAMVRAQRSSGFEGSIARARGLHTTSTRRSEHLGMEVDGR